MFPEYNYGSGHSVSRVRTLTLRPRPARGAAARMQWASLPSTFDAPGNLSRWRAERRRAGCLCTGVPRLLRQPGFMSVRLARVCENGVLRGRACARAQVVTAIIVIVVCIVFGLCVFGTLAALRRKKMQQARRGPCHAVRARMGAGAPKGAAWLPPFAAHAALESRAQRCMCPLRPVAGARVVGRVAVVLMHMQDCA